PVSRSQGPAAGSVDVAGRSARPQTESVGHAQETLAASGGGARPDAGGRGLSGTQRWAIGVAAAGVAAGGVGAAFIVQAVSKNNESKMGCEGNVCSGPSKQARLDARTAGDRATVAMAMAGALLTTGTILFLVGRREA